MVEAHRHCDHNFDDYVPPGALSDYDFPKFDGSNPRSWVQRAETYFDVYGIDLSKWVKIATMHFVGFADLWIHTMKTQIASVLGCFYHLCVL